MRACVQMLAPDAQAVTAALECASEVTRLEAAQLWGSADLSAGAPVAVASRGGNPPRAPADPGPHGGGPHGDARPPLEWRPQIQLQWFAPFFSGGGYSSEAISYVSELQKWLPVGIVQVPKP
jgi:hypothetical protein